jgi:hypothetical protein
MKGTAADTVASSWIEALGGVSMCWILSTPPDFWAATGVANSSPASTSRVIRPFLASIVSSLDDLEPSPSLARGVTGEVSRGDACLLDFAPVAWDHAACPLSAPLGQSRRKPWHSRDQAQGQRPAKTLPRCVKWKCLRSTGAYCEKSCRPGRFILGQSFFRVSPQTSKPRLTSGAFFAKR